MASQTSGVPIAGVESTVVKHRVSELEAEITQLKEQLGKAKAINDGMWDSVVQRIVNGRNEWAQDAAEKEGENELKRRKRSRGA